MSLKTWWSERCGAAKTLTVLATLLILQIGLCFSAPAIDSWFRGLFYSGRSGDPYGPIGAMLLLAVTSGLTAVALLIVLLAAIFRGNFRSRGSEPQRLFEDSDRRN
jgi:hypothetical protein